MAGSISEKVFVSINGVQQGMFLKSKDDTHPVLLYLHGGMPDYFLTQRYSTGLEDAFTVVWWEQRGSGLSYRADIPAVLPWDMVDKSTSPLQTHFKPVCGDFAVQTSLLFSE